MSLYTHDYEQVISSLLEAFKTLPNENKGGLDMASVIGQNNDDAWTLSLLDCVKKMVEQDVTFVEKAFFIVQRLEMSPNIETAYVNFARHLIRVSSQSSPSIHRFSVMIFRICNDQFPTLQLTDIDLHYLMVGISDTSAQVIRILRTNISMHGINGLPLNQVYILLFQIIQKGPDNDSTIDALELLSVIARDHPDAQALRQFVPLCFFLLQSLLLAALLHHVLFGGVFVINMGVIMIAVLVVTLAGHLGVIVVIVQEVFKTLTMGPEVAKNAFYALYELIYRFGGYFRKHIDKIIQVTNQPSEEFLDNIVITLCFTAVLDIDYMITRHEGVLRNMITSACLMNTGQEDTFNLINEQYTMDRVSIAMCTVLCSWKKAQEKEIVEQFKAYIVRNYSLTNTSMDMLRTFGQALVSVGALRDGVDIIDAAISMGKTNIGQGLLKDRLCTDIVIKS
jgi:hypothetical protein